MQQHLFNALIRLLLIALLALSISGYPDFPPVTFIEVHSPSPRGKALVTIRTKPQTPCTISAIFRSGPSHAAGLGSQIAEVKG